MNTYGGGQRSFSRPVFNAQIDVSTQADLVGYESEDERLGKRNRSKRGTPYSKIDIREQYCINNKEVQVLESGSSALFGCLSKHHDGSCKSKNSFLSVCMGRVPSDENLHFDVKLQPLPRKPIDDLERAYLRRRPKSLCGGISHNEIIINADEIDLDYDCNEIKRGHSISFSSEDLATACPAHFLPPPPPPPPPPPSGVPRAKHVSFARSHTLTSFDDAIIELRKAPQLYKSQERLILSTQPHKRSYTPYDRKTLKKTSMKTQATQTGGFSREPPNYLSLSPRTIRRVKMVSQGAQTNGQSWNGRRLMKSYSEAGCHYGDWFTAEKIKDHDVLTRTQSEEPRSPYANRNSPPWPMPSNKANVIALNKAECKKSVKPSRIYKEIFIDFEPVESNKGSGQIFVDGDLNSDQSMDTDANDQIVDRVNGIKVSLASYSTMSEDDTSKDKDDDAPHLFPLNQNSIDETFHENLVYGGIFNKLSNSELSLKPVCPDDENDQDKSSIFVTADAKDLMPAATLNVSLRASPFASNDSLTNDQKDQSDGIWNESQSTVLLQAESENDEMSTLTPSKKQLLLLQQQQRSSIDTEVLESEILYSQMHSPIYSPINQESTVPFVTVAAVHHNESSSQMLGPLVVQKDRKNSARNSLGPNVFFGFKDGRRHLNKSPEKEETKMDSGKATDISETSTTEDYATAYDNSGTDTSSKRQTDYKLPESRHGSKEGSSFESASSIHSFHKEDAAQVVPSSPPTIKEENAEEIPVENNIFQEARATDIKESKREGVKQAEEDKDELSCDAESSSSSGSYSLDSGQRDHKPEGLVDLSEKTKGDFELVLSNDSENWRNENDELKKSKIFIASTHQNKSPDKICDWEGADVGEVTSKMVRSPAMPEGFLSQEDRKTVPRSISLVPDEIFSPLNHETEVSSDESSCGYKAFGTDEPVNGHSPRKHRRRGRRNQGGAEYVCRRRTLGQILPTNQQHHQHQLNPPGTKYGRSPSHSPRGSPRKTPLKVMASQEHKKSTTRPPDAVTHLKTLSAESLRSVSPGSDSVFYNEADTHLLCHQCGREFDGDNIKFKVEENVEEIVQPPAGFADSPESAKVKSHRLFKKQEKRFRSEERGGEKRRNARHRTEGLRAKSEERGKEKTSKSKLRPLARSTEASMERLQGGDSSPSFSEPLTGDDPKIYSGPFKKSSWIFIRNKQTTSIWKPGCTLQEDNKAEEDGTNTVGSTSSEKEFRRKYQAATHRMIHRKSSMEMYKRLQAKTFECDKKVVVKRKSGEFGFRIHGSRPVVVSAIEPETPAESSGLEVGDIVLSVNGVSVLEASHSDVVKLAHAGSDTLELEVARTSTTLGLSSSSSKEEENLILFSGFLSRRGTNGKWHRRWFVLKNDNCLYYFKSQAETQPVGALLLFEYVFRFTPNSGKPNSFILEKEGAKSVELSADTKDLALEWKTHVEKAANLECDGGRRWLEDTCRLLQNPPSSIPEPDCFGHLTQLEDKWRRRYCVLKDAALFLYADSSASRALAVACLQGYRVQSSGVSGKKFSFEVVPPESKQKHFYFYTDTEIDKKRWIAAMEYSIDRWMRVG